jgi:hypothetical protein
MERTAPTRADEASLASRVEAALWDDLVTESDALRLSRHLRSCGARPSQEFWTAHEAWLLDERRHFEQVLGVYRATFSWDAARQARLEARQADFRPLAHLFDDELAVLSLGAYDELVTIRGYRGNLPLYRSLGPAAERTMRAVIADEGRHFRTFLKLIRKRRAGDLARFEGLVARIRACEGTPYAATFVLDHDDPVYGDDLYDEAAALLTRRLRPRA